MVKAKKEEETLVYAVVKDKEGKVIREKNFTVQEWNTLEKMSGIIWQKSKKPRTKKD